MHEKTCFLTLTYTDANLPPDGLRHRDIQLFLKRLRAKRGNQIRYYVCGEYGDNTQRPHYHMMLYGHDYREDRRYHKKSAKGFDMYTSPELDRQWQLGQATIQEMTPETAAYTAGYILTDQRKTPEGCNPPYGRMSTNPAIGKAWLEKYHRDLYPHDYAELNGKRRPIPRYYKTQLADMPYDHVGIENRMLDRLELHQGDNTPERLAVQEAVLTAKYVNKDRNKS